jgi:hypothetical protein
MGSAQRPEREPIIPPWDIPYMISEVDEAPSPPRKPKLNGVSISSSADSEMTGRPSTALRNPFGRPDIYKKLPELPAYLVPSPLFSPRDGPGREGHIEFPNLEDGIRITDSQEPKDFFLDWNFQQSRFSAWSIEDDLLADYAEMSSEGGEDTVYDVDDDKSLTYSPVQTSGQPSPMGYGSQPSRDEMFASLNWLSSSPMSSMSELRYYGGEKSELTRTQPDALKAQHEVEPRSEVEELIDEFNYLGAAL